jgi:hypothetical protein
MKPKPVYEHDLPKDTFWEREGVPAGHHIPAGTRVAVRRAGSADAWKWYTTRRPLLVPTNTPTNADHPLDETMTIARGFDIGTLTEGGFEVRYIRNAECWATFVDGRVALPDVRYADPPCRCGGRGVYFRDYRVYGGGYAFGRCGKRCTRSRSARPVAAG